MLAAFEPWHQRLGARLKTRRWIGPPAAALWLHEEEQPRLPQRHGHMDRQLPALVFPLAHRDLARERAAAIRRDGQHRGSAPALREVPPDRRGDAAGEGDADERARQGGEEVRQHAVLRRGPVEEPCDKAAQQQPESMIEQGTHRAHRAVLVFVGGHSTVGVKCKFKVFDRGL